MTTKSPTTTVTLNSYSSSAEIDSYQGKIFEHTGTKRSWDKGGQRHLHGHRRGKQQKEKVNAALQNMVDKGWGI